MNAGLAPQLVDCLIISVGGSEEPIIKSIKLHRPRVVVFFASGDTRSIVQTILRKLPFLLDDSEIITTPDHQDLVICLQELQKSVPAALKKLETDWARTVVDFTGGTKPMSAALVLLAVERLAIFSYIGGSDKASRDKGGTGVVINGHEDVRKTLNPWDVLATREKSRIARQFNNGHFDEARQTAAEAAKKSADKWTNLFCGIEKISEGFHCWSRFDYKDHSVDLLFAGLRKFLLPFAQNTEDDRLLCFCKKIEDAAGRFKKITMEVKEIKEGKIPPDGGKGVILDLISFARLSNQMGRSEDGVARLYSALEKWGKLALLGQGIDNSRVPPGQVPDVLRAEMEQRDPPKDGFFKLGLESSFRLLGAFDNTIGEKFERQHKKLRGVMSARNESFLAHGWVQIGSGQFDELLAITLDFLEATHDEIPAFPQMPDLGSTR